MRETFKLCGHWNTKLVGIAFRASLPGGTIIRATVDERSLLRETCFPHDSKDYDEKCVEITFRRNCRL